jgi:MtN3 and saliva related transmembrane protein
MQGYKMHWHTILGFTAAACTTISFFPQLIKIIQTKHTKDISLGMYSLITLGIFLWFTYGLYIKDMPIIIANGIAFIATGLILVYKIIYK